MPIIEERARTIISVLGGDTIEAELISVSVSSQAVSGSAFTPGGVNSSQCTMQCMIDNVNPYSLVGSIATLMVYKQGEWTQHGIYNVSSCKRHRNVYNITASDNMILLDVNAFESSGGLKSNRISSYLQTARQPYDILAYILEIADLTLGNSREEVETMPNGTKWIELPDSDNKDGNVRDWLSWICEIMSGFAYADADGTIKIGHFENEPSDTIGNADIVLDNSDIADFVANNFNIELTSYDDWWWQDITVTDERETLIGIDLSDNPLAQGVYFVSCYSSSSHDEIVEKMYDFLGQMWDAIGNLQVRPCDIKVASDKMYRIGQCITVQNPDGNYADTLITSHSWTLGQPQQIKCVGEDTRLISLTRQRSALKRTAESLATSIETAKGTSVTQHDFDLLEEQGKLIEGKVYYVYE